MAHDTQRDFCLRVKARFPERFLGANVLDVGSLDINGNNRYLFEGSLYTGIDLGEGPNVDVVARTTTIAAVADRPVFDVVISTECFEHDEEFERSLVAICEKLLAPGGLFLFTAAGEGRPEHGTARSSPGDSPFTAALPGWSDYYRNVTEEMVRGAVDLDEVFREYEFDRSPGDIYFWGIKK